MHSQPECSSRLICWDRRRTACLEVGQPFESDPTVFEVDHCFVLLDELGWHNRSGALLIAATGDVGDLTTECRFTASEKWSLAWLTESSVESVVMPTILAKYANLARLGAFADGSGVDTV